MPSSVPIRKRNVPAPIGLPVTGCGRLTMSVAKLSTALSAPESYATDVGVKTTSSVLLAVSLVKISLYSAGFSASGRYRSSLLKYTTI